MNNRYEFILLFDVIDGNPNGDPDAGNMPRMDAETSQGLVTDVCLKRKIRNYVSLTRQGQNGFDIYIQEKAILNKQNEKAYLALKLDPAKSKQPEVDQTRKWMCENFYDVRTFGAVMTTKVNCGQVRGPIQLSFARSKDPIVIGDHSITRMAVTTEKESEEQDGGNRTMGRKFTVPYALYQAEGFINPYLADQTNFTEEDLEVFWESLIHMFEFDRSASRGMMAIRALLVFKHEDKLGNAPAHELFDLVDVKKKEGVEVPRSFDDYKVIISKKIPAKVTLLNKIGTFAEES